MRHLYDLFPLNPQKTEENRDQWKEMWGFGNENIRNKKISQICRKLNKKNLLHYGGIVEDIGRPRIFYYRHHLPKHLWNHELGITDFIEALGWIHCRRYRDVDEKIRPDAEIIINNGLHYLEWDTGSESKTQWMKRISHYKENYSLLIVTRDDNRLKDLLKWSEPLGESAYFTTMEHALQTPYEDVWKTLDGRMERLRRPGEKTVDKTVGKGVENDVA